MGCFNDRNNFYRRNNCHNSDQNCECDVRCIVGPRGPQGPQGPQPGADNTTNNGNNAAEDVDFEEVK